MRSRVSELKDEVVELLVVWGDWARPGAPVILEALAGYQRGQPLLILREAIEELPEDMLDPGLRAEIADLHRSLSATGAPGAARDASDRDRLADVASELDSCLRKHHESVSRDLGVWLPVLGKQERGRALSGFWTAESVNDLRGSVTGLREVARLRAMITDARSRVEQEARRTVESGWADTRVLERLRHALESGDAGALASVAFLLGSPDTGGTDPAVRKTALEAQQRLALLCERGRSALDAGTLKGTRRQLLVSALEAAEATIEATPSSPTEIGGEDIDALRSWEVTLEPLLEAGEDEDGWASHESAARAILGRVIEERRAASDEDAGALKVVEQELRGAVEDRVTSVEPLLRASAALRAHYESNRSRLERSTREVRESAGELGEELEKSAGWIPIERLARSRLLLDRIDAAVALGRHDAISSVGSAIREEIQEIRDVAERSQQQRRGRGQAQRRRMLEEIDRLLEAVRGRAAARLKGLRKTVQRVEDPQSLEPRFRKVVRPVANRIRLEAARIAHRLGREGDPRLNEALEQDDLARMAKLSTGLRRRAFGRFRPSASAVLTAIAAVLLVVVLGYHFSMESKSLRSYAYRITVSGVPESSRPQIKLVRDGSLAGTKPYDDVAGITFDLTAGRYEVFVDDRYTGHVITVPGADRSAEVFYPSATSVTN